MTTPRSTSADVLVIGDGVIGLAVALAVARAGGTSWIVGCSTPGRASPAAAGLLAPSIGSAHPAVRRFMTAARDRYPDFVHWLAQRTGIDVPLSRRGIIELADRESDLEALLRHPSTASALEPGVLVSMEPALAPVPAAVLHPLDGYVHTVRLLDAIGEAVRCEWAVDVAEGRVVRIDYSPNGCSVSTDDGRRYAAAVLVLAAGAWSALVEGLPRPLPLEPVRGQMVKLRGAPLGHAVVTSDAYLLPREDCMLVGSTLERVGYDSSTTKSAVERLRACAARVVPALATAEIVDTWAGLRPMTPDALPVIGRDPDVPSLLYACGHGKNGILLAPLTAECIAALAAGSAPPHDLEAFAIERFG